MDVKVAEGMTPAHAGAALRWLSSMTRSDEWSLSIYELAELTGTFPEELQSWLFCAERHEDVVLPIEVLERTGLLLSIYRCLKEISPTEPSVAALWFSKPIVLAPFFGASIKQYLMNPCGKIAAQTVLNFLQANS